MPSAQIPRIVKCGLAHKRGNEFASPTRACAIQKQAVPGIPFGVGRITLDLPQGLDSEIVDTRFFSVSERKGRVFYPAIRMTRPLGLVRELLGAPVPDGPAQLHIHFLFTGAEPLELTLHVPRRRVVTIVPSGREPAYHRLMRAWWIRYKAAARKQRQEGDYAPLVETYLTSVLARRLQLDPPPRSISRAPISCAA